MTLFTQIIAFSTRLFSVLRFESVIHEFDPYFNFRSTKVLVDEGFYEFNNWFDDFSWYPLGRVVGGTVFPGLSFRFPRPFLSFSPSLKCRFHLLLFLSLSPKES